MIRKTPKRNTMLLDEIEVEGRLTTREVAQRMGWKMTYAYKQLQDLRDEGLLRARATPTGIANGIVNAWEVIR